MKPAPLLKIQDVADILNLSVITVRRMVKAREIPCLRVRGMLRFDPQELTQWTPPARDRRRMKNTKDFFTIDWVAQHYGLHQQSVYRLLWSGKVPGAFKVGGFWHIPREALSAIEGKMK